MKIFSKKVITKKSIIKNGITKILNKMQNKKIIIFIGMFLIAMSVSNAVSIGISPGRVRFDSVLRGGYAERTITISTGSEDDLIATIRPDGAVSEWIRFEPNVTTFTVSKDDPYKLKIIAEPPVDLPIGNYSGGIEIISEGVTEGQGRAGAAIKTAVTLLTNLEISGTQITKCRAGGFSLEDAEIGFPFELGATVINDGNVRLTPTITVDIWDQMQDKILLTRSLQGDLVLPTTQRRITRTMANTLSEGQYWANVKVDECASSSMSTFSIVEKGGIIDKGEFIDIINNQPWAKTRETVQIVAKFVNNGARAVNARFKGTIMLDGKIVQLLETDEVIVPAGEVSDFDIFFTPENPGRYTLSGRIIYNKKLTFEKGTIINVNDVGEEPKSSSWVPLAVYVVIIMLIIFMLRKIRDERRKKK